MLWYWRTSRGRATRPCGCKERYLSKAGWAPLTLEDLEVYQRRTHRYLLDEGGALETRDRTFLVRAEGVVASAGALIPHDTAARRQARGNPVSAEERELKRKVAEAKP